MPILCLRGRIGARETHQVEAEKKDRAGLNVFIEEGFSQIASKFFFMKSNDCGNQRLFGGLQIWRERRRRIEKRPRLGAGQRVHRGARGAGGGGPRTQTKERGVSRGGGLLHPPHREHTRKVDVVLRPSVPGRGRGGSYSHSPLVPPRRVERVQGRCIQGTWREKVLQSKQQMALEGRNGRCTPKPWPPPGWPLLRLL